MRIPLVNKDGVLSSFCDVANSSVNDGIVFTFRFAFPFFNFCENCKNVKKLLLLACALVMQSLLLDEEGRDEHYEPFHRYSV